MGNNLTVYGILAVSVVFEVAGTAFLRQSQQFTRLWPTVFMAVSYAIAFYGLTIVVRTIPVGLAYAFWSGLGIVLVSLSGWIFFRQALDLAALIGLTLIVAGIIVINLFSSNAPH